MKDKKEKIYISAPISGYDLNERIYYFNEVALRLHENGYIAVNPLKDINQFGINHNHEEYMKRDIELLLKCDTILLCRDWQNSEGCRLEFEVAVKCGMGVLFLSNGNLNNMEFNTFYPEYDDE